MSAAAGMELMFRNKLLVGNRLNPAEVRLLLGNKLNLAEKRLLLGNKLNPAEVRQNCSEDFYPTGSVSVR